MEREGEDLVCSRAGYRCAFVDPPASVLIQRECPICNCVLRDPQLTDCCGMSFCRTCIDGVRRDQGACPTCQKLTFMVMQDKRVEKSLRELIVACENNVSGCEWKGALGSLDTHLEKSCSFVKVACKYSGCSTRKLRKEISAHEERCGRRPFRCEYCNEYESSFDGVSEHWRTCPKYPSAQSPNQIAEALSKAENQLERSECKLLERMAALETKIGELETKMAEHARTRNFETTMDQRLQVLEAKMSDQKQIVSEAQSTQLRQLLEERLCEQRNGPEADTDVEQKKAFEKLDIKMDEFKKEMKRDIEKHALDVAETNRSVLTSLLFKVLKLPVPPLKMEHTQHKVTKMGKTILRELTFYSHIGGFKLHAQLEVDDVNVKGEFLSKYSVLVHVMCGEFDDCLQWPFEGTLVLAVKKDMAVEEHFIDFRAAPLEYKSKVPSDKIQSKAWTNAIITVKHPSPPLEFTIQNVKF
ncbi:hypothetical protein EMCRGX_G018630 [Ephydatia muelleri]